MKHALLVTGVLLVLPSTAPRETWCYEGRMVATAPNEIALRDSVPEKVEVDFVAHELNVPEVRLADVDSVPTWPWVLVCTTLAPPEIRGGP